MSYPQPRHFLHKLPDKVRALILDFDGTLFRLPVDWDGLRAEVGLPAGASFTEWMQRCLDAGDTASLAVATRYELAAVADGEFTHGARELLRDAPVTRQVAVLTRNSAQCVRAALGGLAQRVRIVGREDVRTLKPHPEGVHAILAELDVAPEHALLVGDTFHDVLAARAAAVPVAVVTNPALRYPPEGADVYLDSLAELAR